MKQITKWIVVSEDYSGLGWAKMLADQPGVESLLAFRPKDDEDNLKAFKKVGNGMVEKIAFDHVLKQREKYREWGFIFDGNHNSDDSEKLRSEGFQVFGGHRFTDWLEHNREFGLALVNRAGLTTPPSQEFDDILAGLDFLDSNADKAYVFKPDEPDHEAWVTTTPDQENNLKANEEMRLFLSSQKQGKGKYILQERKTGVELCIEFWMYKGRPFFANALFECKRKDDLDLGRMTGCSQDIAFAIPIDCKVAKETLHKLITQPEFKDYTGFIDMNLIVADNQYWFLEFCGRFGYNEYPNLFKTLAISTFPEIMSDIVTGTVDNFSRHFRSGFGASITCWIDKPIPGLPISFAEKEVEDAFYHFDTMHDGENYYLAGYANEAGIITAHDYDIKSAADEVLRRFNKIHYPGRTGRTDLARNDYPSNPLERYTACEAMRLFQ